MNQEQRDLIIREARSWCGTPYPLGVGSATAVKGIAVDCSRFVWKVYREVINPDLLYQTTTQVAVDRFCYDEVINPFVGDLVWWPGHIAIVCNPGSGEFIGSQSTTGVAFSNYLTNLYWSNREGRKFFRIRASFVTYSNFKLENDIYEKC